jgi:hypothetical protein
MMDHMMEQKMFNPGIFGVSRQETEAAKETGQHLRLETWNYRRGGRAEVRPAGGQEGPAVISVSSLKAGYLAAPVTPW